MSLDRSCGVPFYFFKCKKAFVNYIIKEMKNRTIFGSLNLTNNKLTSKLHKQKQIYITSHRSKNIQYIMSIFFSPYYTVNKEKLINGKILYSFGNNATYHVDYKTYFCI